MSTGADETRERIRAAALELFCAVGYGSATIDDIASAAGVGVATLYRRWPDKAALANELYHDIVVSMHELFTPVDGGSNKANFMAMWHRMWDWASTHPNEFVFVETHIAEAFISEENAAMKQQAVESSLGVVDDLGLRADIEVVNAMLLGTVATLLRTGTEIDAADVGNRLWQALR